MPKGVNGPNGLAIDAEDPIGFTWQLGGAMRRRAQSTGMLSFPPMAAFPGEACSPRTNTFTTSRLILATPRFSTPVDLSLPPGVPPTAAKPGRASAATISSGVTASFPTPLIRIGSTSPPSEEACGTAPPPAIRKPWKTSLPQRWATRNNRWGREQAFVHSLQVKPLPIANIKTIVARLRHKEDWA